MDFLASPWFIITVVISIIIGNIAALKYLTPKNLDKLKKRQGNDLDRLIELDKKHQQEIKKKDE
ncbi:hypothetical protein [Vibrio gazogenes]|uniref:DUF2897 domain-containing protein n=1 Tax=Vibrio gazogenes DSM 21264 = NBRC 103151 TaxID=1123492 RepID=A0A1M4XJG8_VIBGA|nr:hypothetical protein [Vibrio gazogenes]USP12969.1 DUF2897 domain-containing protein [Vibrio gazogenes]SHE93655.1 hypothetical protein SAMN02745781_01076 [Vibrio gazogenes DSM 21264] [Vibrio gazogenes DSM 21264 = NBRC 103151]SJN58704.1 hypothetical protein BQ6471_03147 [Vibrio gazogenes]